MDLVTLDCFVLQLFMVLLWHTKSYNQWKNKSLSNFKWQNVGHLFKTGSKMSIRFVNHCSHCLRISSWSDAQRMSQLHIVIFSTYKITEPRPLYEIWRTVITSILWAISLILQFANFLQHILIIGIVLYV